MKLRLVALNVFPTASREVSSERRPRFRRPGIAEAAAAVLPDFVHASRRECPLETSLSSSTALLLLYCKNLVCSVGWRETAKIGKPQFGFLRRLLANIRQNCTIAAGPSKDSRWFAFHGTCPGDEVNHAVAAKELNIVKSLHQARKQHVKSLADIMVSFEGGIRQIRTYNQNPAADCRRHKDPAVAARPIPYAAATPEVQLAGVASPNLSASSTEAGSEAGTANHETLNPNGLGASGV